MGRHISHVTQPEITWPAETSCHLAQTVSRKHASPDRSPHRILSTIYRSINRVVNKYTCHIIPQTMASIESWGLHTLTDEHTHTRTLETVILQFRDKAARRIYRNPWRVKRETKKRCHPMGSPPEGDITVNKYSPLSESCSKVGSCSIPPAADITPW